MDASETGRPPALHFRLSSNDEQATGHRGGAIYKAQRASAGPRAPGDAAGVSAAVLSPDDAASQSDASTIVASELDSIAGTMSESGASTGAPGAPRVRQPPASQATAGGPHRSGRGGGAADDGGAQEFDEDMYNGDGMCTSMGEAARHAQQGA
jgi:hypothetical protein